MITSDQRDITWVAHLKGQEQEEGLYRVETSVYEVAHEQVVRAWAVISNTE